jgi:hypothetical protein
MGPRAGGSKMSSLLHAAAHSLTFGGDVFQAKPNVSQPREVIDHTKTHDIGFAQE